MRRPITPPEPLRSLFGPLLELLRRELPAARRQASARTPLTTQEFARWYLAVVQVLEASAAAADRHPPMTRSDVELMCRAALSATSLGEAIGLIGIFCAALHPRAGRVTLVRRRGMAVFSVDPQRHATTSTSSLVDITGLFAFLQLFQWLIGGPLALAQVRIGPMRREDVQPFLRLFGAPALCGGRDYTLEFAAADLARPVVRTRGEFAGFFEVYPCAVLDRNERTPAQQVGALLAASAERTDRMPTLAAVAEALGLPPSTLRRHLQRDGTSFRTLRARALAEQAHAWLERGEFTVAQIGERLGFSDAAAFRRAFRRWSGQTPSSLRRATPD